MSIIFSHNPSNFSQLFLHNIQEVSGVSMNKGQHQQKKSQNISKKGANSNNLFITTQIKLYILLFIPHLLHLTIFMWVLVSWQFGA